MTPDESEKGKKGMSRRDFLITGAMATGLAASYGTLGIMAGRFLYPARPFSKAWVFVSQAEAIKPGESMKYRSPSGQQLTITRQGNSGTAEDFIALSGTCPHLGCQVHWDEKNRHFFCPCHNGVFDTTGKAISGPPAEAGQFLLRYPLKIEGGILYLEVPVDTGPKVALCGKPGHDPCLDHFPS